MPNPRRILVRNRRKQREQNSFYKSLRDSLKGFAETLENGKLGSAKLHYFGKTGDVYMITQVLRLPKR